MTCFWGCAQTMSLPCDSSSTLTKPAKSQSNAPWAMSDQSAYIQSLWLGHASMVVARQCFKLHRTKHLANYRSTVMKELFRHNLTCCRHLSQHVWDPWTRPATPSLDWNTGSAPSFPVQSSGRTTLTLCAGMRSGLGIGHMGIGKCVRCLVTKNACYW